MAILVVTLLVMTPRLLSPHFGLFDDPTTIETSRDLLAGRWSPAMESGEGRYRPLYWYFNAAIFAIFGENPLAYFASNVLLLIALVLILRGTLRNLGADGWGVWAATAALLLSGPLLENAYTLSKPELLQVTLLAAFLRISLCDLGSKRRGPSVPIIASAGLSAMLACLTKETGVILLPLSVALYVSTRLLIRLHWSAPIWRTLATRALAASALGVGAYIGLRFAFAPLTSLGSGYSGGFSFTLSNTFGNTRVFLDIISRDYLYLLPLGIFALPSFRKGTSLPIAWMSMAGIWAVSWLILYVPWRFTQLYYLLPFSLGVSIFLGAIGTIVRSRIQDGPAWQRRVGVLAILAAGLLFLGNVANQVTTSRLQLAVDGANAQLLNTIAAEVPVGSTLMVNIQEPNEYYAQFKDSLVGLKGRGDLRVHYVSLGQLPPRGQAQVFYLLPVFENQFYPSFRIGVYEATSAAWNNGLKTELGDLSEPAFRIRRSFRAFIVDPLRLFCPIASRLAYCQVPNTPFDTRLVSYGWDVYRDPGEP